MPHPLPKNAQDYVVGFREPAQLDPNCAHPCKFLVIPHLDYEYQLRSSYKANKINAIEMVHMSSPKTLKI